MSLIWWELSLYVSHLQIMDHPLHFNFKISTVNDIGKEHCLIEMSLCSAVDFHDVGPMTQ
jgi:hypothetical protein